MRSRSIVLAACVLAATLCVSLAAADEKAPAAKPGPKAAEFYRLDQEMKALLVRLAGLQIKYREITNDERRADLKREMDDLTAKGDKLAPRYLDAAERAYREAPNADKNITDLLMAQMIRCVQRDDFEPAARVGKMMMQAKCDRKPLPALAGIAAFCVSDYDAAEKYLKEAVAKKVPLKVATPDVLEKYYSRGDCPLDKMVEVFLRNPEIFKQAWAKEKGLREDEAAADNLPRVLLVTSKGDIELELFENQAPNTVASFISLVEKKFYDGIAFHRVLPGFMAQGGDPKGNGSGGPGYRIPCECYQENHRTHFRGTLSMAKEGQGGSDGRGRDTGGSQFFLTFVPTAFLDGNYTVFGRVVKGFDVLAKLQRRSPDDAEAPRPDKIIEAKVLRKRPHDYKPRKMPE